MKLLVDCFTNCTVQLFLTFNNIIYSTLYLHELNLKILNFMFSC